jgi:hypothetical protein
MSNKNLVLIVGKSATGKTASLRNLKDPDGVLFLNCESGKELPFPAPFRIGVVSNPLEIFTLLTKAEQSDKIHTIVIDSLTYLMDMFETQVVLRAKNKMEAWSEYAQFFKRLMQEYVAVSKKNIIFTAHTSDVLNEGEMVMETLVKVKGSLMNQGIESYFNNVISCKVVPTGSLADYENDMLNITEEEDEIEVKYVFQTRKTKATVNDRIRGPLNMWKRSETYIDNDLQMVIDRLHDYYAPARASQEAA